MEASEDLGSFVIAVEELGVTGLWTTIRDVSSVPWREVPLRTTCAVRSGGGVVVFAPLAALMHALNGTAPTPTTQLLEARTPLQGLMLSNKFGKPSQVAKLPLTCVAGGCSSSVFVRCPARSRMFADLLLCPHTLPNQAATIPHHHHLLPQLRASKRQAPAAAAALLPQPCHVVPQPLRAPDPGARAIM